MKKIIVAGRCWTHDCDCNIYDGANPDSVGYPPFHKDCFCYIIDEKLERSMKIVFWLVILAAACIFGRLIIIYMGG